MRKLFTPHVSPLRHAEAVQALKDLPDAQLADDPNGRLGTVIISLFELGMLVTIGATLIIQN